MPRQGAEERRALERLLRDWSQAHRGCAVAAYVLAKDGLHRAGAVGSRDFGKTLDAGGPLETGVQRLDLAGGSVLLHDAVDPVAGADAPALALLASVLSVLGLKGRLDEQNLFAMAQGVELAALYEVGLAIASILDLDQLAEEVLSRALLLLDAPRGALYRLEGGSYLLTRARGEAAPELDPARVDLILRPVGSDGAAPDLLPGAPDAVAVPIESEGARLGLLVVGADAGEREDGAFQAKDRRTAALFANQAAIAMEKARLHRLALEKQRLDRELELAAEIQQRLLPETMPQIPGFEVVGWNRPARVVGGDYFTFRDLGERGWAIVVGDVSGKGSPAALLVSTLDSALRVLLGPAQIGSELVERLNELVLESSTGNRYITMILTALDPTSGRLTYLNAGHNAGILLKGDGQHELLESTGPPVGLLPIAQFEPAAVDLAPGDLVCLYSDGITECADPSGEEFEIERLLDLLREHQGEPLDRVVQEIERVMTDFVAGGPQGDDQTVVLLRRATA
jgi:sigma-B regulation protein RsbU (phosphoserine phosphatase)